MTATIEVYRGDGSRQAADVVEPLLADSVLIYRGKAEMDADTAPMFKVGAEVVYRKSVRLGQLVSVRNIATSKNFRAKVTGVSMELKHGEATMNLVLERTE